MPKINVTDAKGLVQSAGAGLNVSSTTTFGVPAVVNLADDGSIPVTSTSVNVDANGGHRTGIRFGGVGTAGQLLVVHNTGGENLIFHNTEGTAKLKGVAGANDTMLPGGVYVFISTGALWVLIGGGAATNAPGLAAP